MGKTTIEHSVVIAGGGPTGLMLAGELALAGVDVAIIERRSSQELVGSRARGVLPRTIELFDQRGIADRFVTLGERHPVMLFSGALLDTSDLPTRHHYWLALPQNRIEQVLADWVTELQVPIYRNTEVVDFTQDDTCVYVELDDSRLTRAQYLVGCDGGRSLIRKKAGIGFEGWGPALSYLIFEADMTEEPAWGIRHGENGINALGPLDGGKRLSGVLTEQDLKRGDQPTLDELQDALTAAYGTDYGIHNVTWLSRFSDAALQAESYRDGRVLLAGDAAHVHSPVGGQGLSIGIQDAVNLGWKLAQVVKGVSPERLLDSYQTEQYPVAARVLKTTLALTALNRGDERTNALREIMVEVIQMDQPRKWYTAMMSGLDVRYDLGEGHPLLGRRMPDVELVTAEGPSRVFACLHTARPVLINLGEPGDIDIGPWLDKVQLIDAKYEGAWELPVHGSVATPNAVLIRPDGHVAWVGDKNQPGLMDALATWVGPGDECGRKSC